MNLKHDKQKRWFLLSWLSSLGSTVLQFTFPFRIPGWLCIEQRHCRIGGGQGVLTKMCGEAWLKSMSFFSNFLTLHVTPFPGRNSTCLMVSLKMGLPLVIIHFRSDFHYKPSSYWGTPVLGNFQILIQGRYPMIFPLLSNYHH